MPSTPVISCWQCSHSFLAVMSAGDNDPSTNSILGKITRELGIDQITAPEGADDINLDDVADVLQRQPSFEPVGSTNHALKTFEPQVYI